MPLPFSVSRASPRSRSVVSEKSLRRMYPVSLSTMNTPLMVGMFTSSRSTESSIRSVYPARRSHSLTCVPLGPFRTLTACSLVQPLVSWPSMRAMTSPRRMPLRYAGDPSKRDITVMSPSIGVMLMPSP